MLFLFTLQEKSTQHEAFFISNAISTHRLLYITENCLISYYYLATCIDIIINRTIFFKFKLQTATVYARGGCINYRNKTLPKAILPQELRPISYLPMSQSRGSRKRTRRYRDGISISSTAPIFLEIIEDARRGSTWSAFAKLNSDCQ